MLRICQIVLPSAKYPFIIAAAFFLLGGSTRARQEQTPTPIPSETGGDGAELMPKPEPEPLCPEAPPEEPGTPVPQTEPFKDPPIKHTLHDFLKARPAAQQEEINRTDPLLRPPFAGQPTDTIKGMAAGIRFVELDAKNRILAAQYLGTVDCVTYPQAKEMLIQAMQEDPQEEVRYEAVMALRLMLTRGYDEDQDSCECEGCCNRREIVEATQRHAERAKKKAPKKKLGLPEKISKVLKAPCVACKKKRDAKKNGPVEHRRYDWCRGCCSARSLQALTKVAYDTDSAGCPLEPSARIRQAAVDALCLCPCAQAYPQYAAPIPVIEEKKKGGEQVPEGTTGEESPPPVPPSEAWRARQPLQLVKARTPQAPELAALNGYCIVSLQSKQFVPGKPEFSTVYDGRTYRFATQAAQDEFERFPEGYVPALGGADPVEKIDRQQTVEGKFLRLHQGRFYLFSTKDNWTTFQKNADRYIPSDVEAVSGGN